MSNYRNNEEKFFADWLNELKKKKIVLKFEYEKTNIQIIPEQGLLDKNNNINHLFFGWSYTPDFIVKWNPKHPYVSKLVFNRFLSNTLTKKQLLHEKKTKLFMCDNDFESIIDVKGSYGNHHNSTIIFPLVQKACLYLHDKYINKTVIDNSDKGLFMNSFFPNTYFYTDKGKLKKVKGMEKWKKLEDVINDIN